MKKGDIVLVAFPFSDFSTFKLRPALCLTDPVLPYDQFILAGISSQAEKGQDGLDIFLDSSEEWFPYSGLKKTSIVKIYKLLTVNKSYIKREIGNLPPIVMKDVISSICNLLNFR